MSTNVLIVCSAEAGSGARLGQALTEGAAAAGAEIRRRCVINERRCAQAEGHGGLSAPAFPIARLHDLEWAHGVGFIVDGRSGNVTAALKRFLDSTGPLWNEHRLVDKVVTAVADVDATDDATAGACLALYLTVYHWGGVVLPACAPVGSVAGTVRTGRRLGQLAGRVENARPRMGE